MIFCVFTARLHVSSSYMFGVLQPILGTQEFSSLKNISTSRALGNKVIQKVLNKEAQSMKNTLGQLVVSHWTSIMVQRNCLTSFGRKTQPAAIYLFWWFCWVGVLCRLCIAVSVRMSSLLNNNKVRMACFIALFVKLRYSLGYRRYLWFYQIFLFIYSILLVTLLLCFS